MTIYDFVKRNRVEVTMDKNGVYQCYINYTPGAKASGTGTNALDAIDNGVTAYINSHRPQAVTPINSEAQKAENDALRLFLSKDAMFIWYFFARKYNKLKIAAHYEQLAHETHPNYLNVIRYIYETVNQAIENPHIEIVVNYPAINNLFIQALVYYESLKIEKYENNKIISELLKKVIPEDRKAFDKIQEMIEKVDTEIQKIEED